MSEKAVVYPWHFICWSVNHQRGNEALAGMVYDRGIVDRSRQRDAGNVGSSLRGSTEAERKKVEINVFICDPPEMIRGLILLSRRGSAVVVADPIHLCNEVGMRRITYASSACFELSVGGGWCPQP